MADAPQFVPCPVCARKDFHVLLTPADVQAEGAWLRDFYAQRVCTTDDHAEFTQSELTYVVCCRRCGTLMRNPRPSPETLTRRYRHDHYGRHTLEALLESERQFFSAKAGRFDLPSGARVLEVGSFVGAFLLAAKERDWEAIGLDIGEETSAFCRSRGLHVLTTELANFALQRPPSPPDGTRRWDGHPFSAVFIWNTFDQLDDPRGALAAVRLLLDPGGFLVLRVPNGAFERNCLELKREWRSLRPQRVGRIDMAMAYNNFLTFPYLTGYTPASLSRLLREEGFDTRSVRGDTILPLSDHCTPSEFVREEDLIKRATLRACNLAAESWPWIDVVATRLPA